MKPTIVESFGLVIIESLHENDIHGNKQKKTGSYLFESLIKYKKFQEPELTTRLYSVNTMIEFFDILEIIVKDVRNNNFFPILHIETHGCDVGIQLASGEIISWKDFFVKTTELNILIKNRLVINLAMCSGTSIISKIDPTNRAPFGTVVSTTKNIDFISLQNAFEEYYDHFFFSFSTPESVERMNKVIDNHSDAKFDFVTSEHCFDIIVNPDFDPTHFQRMVNQYAVIEKSTNPYYIETDFNYVK